MSGFWKEVSEEDEEEKKLWLEKTGQWILQCTQLNNESYFKKYSEN